MDLTEGGDVGLLADGNGLATKGSMDEGDEDRCTSIAVADDQDFERGAFDPRPAIAVAILLSSRLATEFFSSAVRRVARRG